MQNYHIYAFLKCKQIVFICDATHKRNLTIDFRSFSKPKDAIPAPYVAFDRLSPSMAQYDPNWLLEAIQAHHRGETEGLCELKKMIVKRKFGFTRI
jgi:hypothetical protein